MLAIMDLDLQSVSRDSDLVHSEDVSLSSEVREDLKSDSQSVSSQEEVDEAFISHLGEGLLSVPEANVLQVNSNVVQSQSNDVHGVAAQAGSVEKGLGTNVQLHVVWKDVRSRQDDVLDPVIHLLVRALDAGKRDVGQLFLEDGKEEVLELTHHLGVELRSSHLIVVEEVVDEDSGIHRQLVSEGIVTNGVGDLLNLFEKSPDDVVIGQTDEGVIESLKKKVESLNLSRWNGFLSCITSLEEVLAPGG